jgi:virginiamycin B lyase
MVVLVAALLASSAGPGGDRAEAGVYWGGPSFGRANLDGSEVLWPLPDGWFPALAGSAHGLEVTDQHLYWAEPSSGSIGRAALDGRDPNHELVKGLVSPVGVAVDGRYLYWSDQKANAIGRALLDGSAADPTFITGATSPCGVASDAQYLYWANQEAGTIGRATLDGTVVDQNFIEGLKTPCGIEVGSGYVFWGDQMLDTLGRAAIDGTEVIPSFVTEAGEPWDLALNASHVFWADRQGDPSRPQGGLGRASLDGGEVIRDLVPETIMTTGVAVDARTFAKDLTPKPSDYLRFGKVTHDRKRGTVQVIVEVPARGEFRVDAPLIGWSIDKGDPPPWLGGTFKWRLRLWPGNGPAGRRIKCNLRRGGLAYISLLVTYQQEGRLPIERRKPLVLQRRVKKPKPKAKSKPPVRCDRSR